MFLFKACMRIFNHSKLLLVLLFNRNTWEVEYVQVLLASVILPIRCSYIYNISYCQSCVILRGLLQVGLGSLKIFQNSAISIYRNSI